MNKKSGFGKKYQQSYENTLVALANELRELLLDLTKDFLRTEAIIVRAKLPSSFAAKAMTKIGNKKKYADPLNQIQDQIGARIVVRYREDVQLMCDIVSNYFGAIEKSEISPERDDAFGYEGRHFILHIPSDFLTPERTKEHCPRLFELQIRTLFQHAWAQTTHDISYKPPGSVSREQARKFAFVAAQAWGADEIVNELAIEQGVYPDV